MKNLLQPKWKMTSPGNLFGKTAKLGSKIDVPYKKAVSMKYKWEK